MNLEPPGDGGGGQSVGGGKGRGDREKQGVEGAVHSICSRL